MSERLQHLQPWDGSVALAGPNRPANDGSIDYLICYLLTVRERFGNTCVTADLQWGANALWIRDAQKDRIKELEAELASLVQATHGRRCDATPDNEVVETLLCPEDVGTSTQHYNSAAGVNKGICAGCGCSRAKHRSVTVSHIVDVEQARWQDGVRNELLKYVESLPEEFQRDVDGGGCESGDPLDVTTAEVRIALGAYADYVEHLKTGLTRSTDVPKDHVRFGDGRVVKFAGSPVYDGNGVLLFPGAVVWPVHQIEGDEGGTVEFCVLDNACGDLCRKDEWIPDANFVDRAAALAASGKGVAG